MINFSGIMAGLRDRFRGNGDTLNMEYEPEEMLWFKLGEMKRLAMSDSWELRDSGERRSFDTGAVRDAEVGKGRYDLLPYFSLAQLARHFEAGANKYDANNWRRGIPLHVYFDSCMRHLSKHAQGYTDEPHMVAALWNIACYLETEERIRTGQLPETLKDFPHVRTDGTDSRRGGAGNGGIEGERGVYTPGEPTCVGTGGLFAPTCRNYESE